MMKKIILVTITILLYGCATVDGMRTDVGNGVGAVANWIKPSEGNKNK